MSSNPRVPFELSTDRAALPAPDGKPLIIQLVVNLENWRFDEAMPRKLLTPPHGRETVPDVPNFSWAEYGLRSGLPRIIGALNQYGLKATCSINASVVGRLNLHQWIVTKRPHGAFNLGAPRPQRIQKCSMHLRNVVY